MTAFIIGGHQRSGTTVLARVLARHLQVGLTGEFDNFQGLNRPLRENIRLLLKRWPEVRLSNDLLPPSILKRANFVRNTPFIPLYLLGLLRSRYDRVTLKDIESTLRLFFPHAHVVGDKYPDYIFMLDRLSGEAGLKRIIIYRDCRDVASSALAMARTNWRNKSYVRFFDTAGKVAARWVRAIETMEHHRGHIHTMRYEDLVHEPKRELAALAARLGIDSDGFPADMVREDHVGKHARGLSAEELGAVMKIAGPTMEKLGYSS